MLLPSRAQPGQWGLWLNGCRCNAWQARVGGEPIRSLCLRGFAGLSDGLVADLCQWFDGLR